jgi:hypothetical protein
MNKIKISLSRLEGFYLLTVAWLSFNPVTIFRKDFKWREEERWDVTGTPLLWQWTRSTWERRRPSSGGCSLASF